MNTEVKYEIQWVDNTVIYDPLFKYKKEKDAQEVLERLRAWYPLYKFRLVKREIKEEILDA